MPVWTGLAAMALLALVTRAPFFGHPAPDFDEQLYSLIGRGMLHGAVPYVDLWDRKPLGLFLIFAGAHGLLGDGAIAYQVVALAACLVGGWLCWRLAARIVSAGAAVWAACLYPPLMAIYGSYSGQSEVFLMVPVLGMAECVAMARARAARAPVFGLLAGAMALGGLALQVKYTALGACLWFALVALAELWRRGWGWWRLGGAALGFGLLGLGPTGLAAAWYAAHGNWDAFAFANFLSAGRRAGMPWAVMLGAQLVNLAPLALLAVAGVVLGLRRGVANGDWWIALGWLVCGAAGLFVASTVYPYCYAALVAPVILVALPLIDGRRTIGAVTLAGLLAWLLVTWNPVRLWHDAQAERAALAGMVREVAPAISAGHPLWVFDGPVALYRLAGSGWPTRYIYPDHLDNALEARALPVDPVVEVARILRGAPGAIVTSPQPVTLRNRPAALLVERALAADYRLAGRFRFTQRPILVFVRKGIGRTTELANRQSFIRIEGRPRTGFAVRFGKNGTGVP